MKVVVLYENQREQHEAQNLANVLASLAPTLAVAKVDKHGGVTQNFRPNMAVPKVEVQARNYHDVFSREIEIDRKHSWGGQTVRNVPYEVETALKPAWADLPGLIFELSKIYGVDPALVENLVRFADSASA